MVNFLVIIFLLSIILFFIGLIKPSFIKFKSRKKVLVIGTAVMFSLFLIIGIAADPIEESQTIESEERNEIKEKEAAKAEAAAEKAKAAEAAKQAKEAEEAKQAKEAEAAKQAKETEILKKENLNDLKAHFIDVGQGDAILLEYSTTQKKYNILIDSGDWRSSAAVNYLNQLNTKDIDLLVGTHPHADHIGQMDRIINEFNVDEVWMSGEIATTQVFERTINAIEKNNVDYYEPRSGEEFAIGPLDIKVLAPKDNNNNLNNSSIVFKATYGKTSFLFTGDAEKSSEQTMLNSGENLKADILKLGHHGSDTSSTPSFVDAVNPEVGIISVGKKNSYGHPSASVIDQMKKRKIDLYSTSNNGTVVVKTDGQKYNVTTNKDGNVTPNNKASSSNEKSTSLKATSNKSASIKNTSNQTTSQKNQSQKKKEIQPSSTKEKKKEKTSNNCIDINTASKKEVQKIIHIAEVRSSELVKLRPYNSIDDLTKIKGIGPARIDDIKSQGLACTGG